jgi:hypothetical protein
VIRVDLRRLHICLFVAVITPVHLPHISQNVCFFCKCVINVCIHVSVYYVPSYRRVRDGKRCACPDKDTGLTTNRGTTRKAAYNVCTHFIDFLLTFYTHKFTECTPDMISFCRTFPPIRTREQVWNNFFCLSGALIRYRSLCLSGYYSALLG